MPANFTRYSSSDRSPVTSPRTVKTVIASPPDPVVTGQRQALLPLDAADAQPECLVPPLPAQALGQAVPGVPAPAVDRVEAVPVGDRDADAVLAAGALDAEEARLPGREPDHFLRHGLVTLG